jgi:hypothetical protein
MVVWLYSVGSMAELLADANGQVYEDMMLPAERVDIYRNM